MIPVKQIALAGILVLGACEGGAGGGAGSSPGGNAELVAVHHGRLVDVYGLRKGTGGLGFSLYRTDVLVGPDIRDEREVGDDKPDRDILFDFISANPESLQPRLFIPRDVESEEFREAFEMLDDSARVVRPAQFGQPNAVPGFSVVPRNACIRLTFARSLGITNEFFVARNEAGQIVGLRNNEAVQLLKIVGDPTDSVDEGDFEVLPARINFSEDFEGNSVRLDQIIIDPVLLGGEGLQYQTRNTASGMPEAPDQIGANMRIAVALEGPLAIPGIREDKVGDLTGKNNSSRLSVIRDLRSGNRLDDSSDISRGFIRDPIPPRIVGEIPFLLERVEDIDEFTQEITLFKGGVNHEIDRGDVIRLVPNGDATGDPVAVTEVLVDPLDDRNRPEEQHVRAWVRRVAKVPNDLGQLIDPIEAIDPSNDPGYPQDPQELEGWLTMNAARATLVTEYTASRLDPLTDELIRDDPRNFITFSPAPLPDPDGTLSRPGENISPFAGAIIRFTKPVDLTTVKITDHFFFATRNLLDTDEVESFMAAGGRGPETKAIEPTTFRMAKYRTPHLIASRLFDEDGSQTLLRLQTMLGFFLNNKMREDGDREFDDKEYKYFLHVVSGSEGISDLSGNPIDFQAATVEDSERIVIPFTLDVRMRSPEQPLFPNNIVASIVRPYNDPDEDEQPSYYSRNEVQGVGEDPGSLPQSVPDIFGGVVYLADGGIQARSTARTRQIVDNLNQAPPPPQSSDFRWCPRELESSGFTQGPEEQVAANTATAAFGQGIQNPLNPFGCRLQTVWREIDMSLSRVDPFDFNLDVEQLYWAPFTGNPIRFDEFDRVSLFLGHSEWRPEPCVGATSSLPSMSDSGLRTRFEDNYLHNLQPLNGEWESGPAPHPAYVDATLTVDPNQGIMEPRGINRFLPLPTFQEPYFVWRDETVVEQGGASGRGRDTNAVEMDFTDYILSPFMGGLGRKVTWANPGVLRINQGTWSNADNVGLEASRGDGSTGGLVGAIALPLLADFWTYCDSPDLPDGNGFIAAGTNGWQIAITVQSHFLPAFRRYSGGFAGFGAKPPECVDPSSPKWGRASGGFTPQGGGTISGDNSVYWIMADFLKRTTVATAGFVDIINPHRVPFTGSPDTRLGPYYLPSDWRPTFVHDIQPPPERLPGGTSVELEFRAASITDPDPWRAREENYDPAPSFLNFPLDPFKAGDAGIRKFDDRATEFTGGAARNWWTYLYNRTVTSYTKDLNSLMDPRFLRDFEGPFESFQPEDVRYFNWRFLMTNNVDANPPVSPVIDSFMVSYRFELSR